MFIESEQVFVEFLAQKENFRVALQVAERMGEVKLHIRSAFMSEIEHRMEELFAGEIRAGWKLERLDITTDRWMFQPGVCLLPPGIEKPLYVLRIQQYVNFYFGIWGGWGDKGAFPDHLQGTEPHKVVAEDLRRRGYDMAEPTKWLGFTRPLAPEKELDDVLLHMVEEHDKTLEQILDHMEKEFRQHIRDTLIRLNSG